MEIKIVISTITNIVRNYHYQKSKNIKKKKIMKTHKNLRSIVIFVTNQFLNSCIISGHSNGIFNFSSTQNHKG